MPETYFFDNINLPFLFKGVKYYQDLKLEYEHSNIKFNLF